MGGLNETSNGTNSFTIASIDFVNDLSDEVHATIATEREITNREPSEIKHICLFLLDLAASTEASGSTEVFAN